MPLADKINHNLCKPHPGSSACTEPDEVSRLYLMSVHAHHGTSVPACATNLYIDSRIWESTLSELWGIKAIRDSGRSSLTFALCQDAKSAGKHRDSANNLPFFGVSFVSLFRCKQPVLKGSNEFACPREACAILTFFSPDTLKPTRMQSRQYPHPTAVPKIPDDLGCRFCYIPHIYLSTSN